MEILGPEWDLSTEVLFDRALTAILAESDEQHTYLVALHARPTQEVFDRADALLGSDSPLERQLAARVLRELGPATPAGQLGPRPFHEQTGQRLLAALAVESDPRVISWLVSALGWQPTLQAFEPLMTLASHHDEEVRSAVASNLAHLVDETSPDPRAIRTLKILSADPNPEIRYDAWWALIEDLHVAPDLIEDALQAARTDSDEQLREMVKRYLTLSAGPAQPSDGQHAT